MSHTQGKMKYFSTEDGLCRINPENGGLIVAECSVRNPFDVEQTANARRLVACWNACIDQTTENLEADFDQGYSPWAHVVELEAQRDELLEALHLLAQHIPGIIAMGWLTAEQTDAVRAAIQKAEGKV